MLTYSSEVGRLPGCGEKIARLYVEFENTGQLREIQEADSSEKMSAIKIFYQIWGVSTQTALDFYNKGWRDIDGLVDNWSLLQKS